MAASTAPAPQRMPEAPASALGSRLRRRLGGLGRGAWTVLLTLYALALGAGLGLLTADRATRGGYPFGAVTVGAWKVWPRAGSTAADPYTRAIVARRGDIPLAVGEGLLLTAAADDAGRALDAACTYTLTGQMPPARAWTLTVTGRGGPEGPAPMRTGFTATEILREADGRFAIALSPEAQPGNWLPSPRAEGALHLAVRLYDTPAAASAGSLDRDSVPAIARTGCRS